MSFTAVEHLCKTMKEENEDAFLVSKHYACVIDGASGLTKTHISDSSSDTAWFVSRLIHHIEHELDDACSLCSIVETACRKTQKEFHAIGGSKLDLIDHPGAVIAFIRVLKGRLEYYILGDCECLVVFDDGSLSILRDERVDALDQKAIEIGKEIQKKKGISFKECRSYYQHQLIENRKLKHQKNGYYVLDDTLKGVHHALMGWMPTDTIKHIALLSDGFAQYYRLFNLADDEIDFMKQLNDYEIVDMYEALKKAQDEDVDFNDYPRFSHSDDATLIHIKLK